MGGEWPAENLGQFDAIRRRFAESGGRGRRAGEDGHRGGVDGPVAGRDHASAAVGPAAVPGGDDAAPRPPTTAIGAWTS